MDMSMGRKKKKKKKKKRYIGIDNVPVGKRRTMDRSSKMIRCTDRIRVAFVLFLAFSVWYGKYFDEKRRRRRRRGKRRIINDMDTSILVVVVVVDLRWR
jgi:hypothetical protein